MQCFKGSSRVALADWRVDVVGEIRKRTRWLEELTIYLDLSHTGYLPRSTRPERWYYFRNANPNSRDRFGSGVPVPDRQEHSKQFTHGCFLDCSRYSPKDRPCLMPLLNGACICPSLNATGRCAQCDEAQDLMRESGSSVTGSRYTGQGDTPLCLT